jgi:enolase
MDATDQAGSMPLIALDGTPSRTSARTRSSASMACPRAARSHDLPLYRYLGGVGAVTLPCR